MKNLRKFFVIGLALVMALGMMVMFAGCGGSEEEATDEAAVEETADVDLVAACNEAIEAIQIQEWTDDTPALCEAAKAAYDALSDEQKEELDDPDYFGLDTGDASKDDRSTVMTSARMSCWWYPSVHPSTTAEPQISVVLRLLWLKRILTGVSEEHSQLRSSSTTSTHVTVSRSTIPSRLCREQLTMALRTWSSSRHT